MKNNDEKNSQINLPFVTVALVVVSSLLRLVVWDADNATIIVSVLNLIMFTYVLYRILTYTYHNVKKQDKHDNISKNQIKACKRLITLSNIILFIVTVVYVGSQFLIEKPNIYSVFNDVIAIVTFGISIEEESIGKKLCAFFENNTFM